MLVYVRLSKGDSCSFTSYECLAIIPEILCRNLSNQGNSHRYNNNNIDCPHGHLSFERYGNSWLESLVGVSGCLMVAIH